MATKLRWVAIALAVAGILLGGQLVAIAAARATAPAIGWKITFPNVQVLSGLPAEITVIGPQSTDFIVQVTMPPWNGSSPVFEAQGTTPPDPSNSSRPTSYNLSMPTAPFPTAEYQAIVQVQAFTVAWALFWIVPNVNTSQLNGTVAAVYAQLVVDQEILLTDRQQLVAAQNQGNLQWWALWISVGVQGFLLVLAIGRGNKGGSLRSFYDSVVGFFHHPNHNIVIPAGMPTSSLVAAPNVDKQFTSGCCDLGRTLSWSEPKIREHLLSAHPGLLGPGGPRFGVNYHRDLKAAAAIEEFNRPPPTSFTREDRNEADDLLGIDLTEVLGG